MNLKKCEKIEITRQEGEGNRELNKHMQKYGTTERANIKTQ